MNVLGYEMSERFNVFCKDQKESLGIEVDIDNMNQHPRKEQFIDVWGLNIPPDNHSNVLKVYVNLDLIYSKGISTELTKSFVEIISVHEILHEWARNTHPNVSFPVGPHGIADPLIETISNMFLNVFHHLVIIPEIRKQGFDASRLEQLVATDYLERIKADEPLPLYKAHTCEFNIRVLRCADFYFRLPDETYRKIGQTMKGKNPLIIEETNKCVTEIKEINCDIPDQMFTAMNKILKRLSLEGCVTIEWEC